MRISVYEGEVYMPAVTRQVGLTDFRVEPIEAYDAATLAEQQHNISALDAEYAAKSAAYHQALDAQERATWAISLFAESIAA